MRALTALTMLMVLLTAGTAHSADWDSCADDLDRLRRAARDAADVAERVKSAASALENCRQFPGTFDLMRDRCRSLRDDFETEVSNLQSELDDVDRRVRDVSSSCAVDLGSARGAPFARPSSGNRMCDLMRRYKGRLPDSTLIEACGKSMPEDECRKCLAAP